MIKIKCKKTVICMIAFFSLAFSIGIVLGANSFPTSTNSFPSGVGGQITGGFSIYGASVNSQFNNPSFFSGANFVSSDVYWPKFNTADCIERQDFIMQIAPGGCSPSVVRSDLLEEQNVPVFCKVMSVTVNPLIEVSKIRSLRFTGKYPAGISGISYYPAKAAIRSQTNLISSPVNDNIGYVVFILARQQNESSMPDSIKGNVTATIDYDIENAFGTGNPNFYINELSDEEWLRDYKEYGFWNGKGYIRADYIQPDSASITIYRDADSKVASVSLKKGETSRDLYLSGFYCSAGMNIRLESVQAPVDSALVQINGEQMWIAKGDRLMNGKCTVSSLDAYSGGGKISLSCPVKNGRIDLSLNAGKASLSSGSGYNEYAVGDRVSTNENIYLGYVGQDFKGNKFAVLIRDIFSTNFNEFTDKQVFSVVEGVLSKNRQLISEDSLRKKIIEEVKKEYKRKLGTVIGKDAEEKINVAILTSKEPAFGISLGEVEVPKNREWDLTKAEDIALKEYYDWAIKYYDDLVSLYPNEKVIEGSAEESYASQGLYEAAQLSKKVGMNEKAVDYYNQLIREYPNSALAISAERERDLFVKFGNSNSRAAINVNNNYYYIELLDFKKPTKEDASAVLLIDSQEKTIGLNDFETITDRNNTQKTFQITEINDEYVILKYSKTGFADFARNLYSNSNTNARTERLALNSQTEIDGVRVKLININLKKQAKISIIPKMYGPRAESNFSFAIGIEKRAIELSPKKTSEMMDKLKDDMKQWEDVNEKLGDVITGLKGACFATSALLTAKNLFSGLSGEAMARKELMTKSGGWNDFCEKEANNGKYTSVQTCLLSNNAQIQKDIGIYQKQIEGTNGVLKNIQGQVGINRTDILDLNGQVDAKKVEERFKQNFNDFCKNAQGSIALPGKENEAVGFSGDKGICSWDTLTLEQRKDIMTLYNTKSQIQSQGGSSVLTSVVDKELSRVTADAKEYWEYEGVRRRNEEERKKFNMGVRAVSPEGDKVTLAEIKTISSSDSSHQVYGKYNRSDSVVLVNVPFKESFAGAQYSANSEVAGKQVVVKIKKDSSGNYIPDRSGQLYFEDGTAVSQNASASVFDYLGFKKMTQFRDSNLKAYQNHMANSANLMVKYFERAPYKGMPAEVPFDIENGWYTEMTYVLSGFGKPYDESGRVVNFYICNVGANGVIEFKQGGDDICRYYNGNTGADLDFPGMSASESRAILVKAQQAIYEAARQYGKERVMIGKNNFKSGISFGTDEGRCSDFMSPEDCLIMFNVCDPVMCPASRCDLGGEFRVDNVVQTGVFGSLLLCLPNYKEGIAVPICLSGVHAGIEGYLSILNSTVQCLNESLVTGRNIGICDEIKSIYLCEFFWKQFTPLINVLIPRLLENFFSQGTRGGGEYMTVKNAWDNMQSSINYFKDSYAVTAINAFRLRSTEEVGSEVCKSFNSIVYPSKSVLDKLLEPDSPAQYTGWFSEDLLTSATVPSTSHYKVYYHIYGGRDQGSYYVVYLKDLPESNYVFMSQMLVVDRGYIERGGQIDQAKDFTAVSGYKQLCININGQDECGFGKVSSSYLINSLTDSYAAEQIKTGISNEKECVAGTPSLTSVINPNLQAGVEDVLEPAIYNNGIIRVCASQNPGKKVLPSGEYDTTNSTFDRWKDVGYCDDPTIRCWLDTSSVKDVITNKQIEKDVLKKVDLNVLGQVDFWTEEKSMTTASEMENTIKNLVIASTSDKNSIDSQISPIASKLLELTNLGTSNKYRARGFYLLAKLYSKVSQSLVASRASSISTTSISSTEASGGAIYINPPTMPGSVSEVDKWKTFYYYSNGKWVLKAINPKTGKEEEMQTNNFDYTNEIVTLDDGSMMRAVIQYKNGKNVVVLQDLSKFTESNPGAAMDSDDTTAVSEVTGEDLGSDEWQDNMLKENVTIKSVTYTFLGISSSTIPYKYYSGNWVAPSDSDFKSKNYGYVAGVREIVRKAYTGNADIWIGNEYIQKTSYSSANQMSEEVLRILNRMALDAGELPAPSTGYSDTVSGDIVFEFQDDTAASNIFYTFENGNWYWSYFRDPKTISNAEWYNANDDPAKLSITSRPRDKDVQFIRTLSGKNCEVGLQMLTDRVLSPSAGDGANPGIVQYIGTESKTIANEELKNIAGCSASDYPGAVIDSE